MGVGLPSGVIGTFWNSMALVVSAQCCECTHVPNGKFCSVYSTTIKKKKDKEPKMLIKAVFLLMAVCSLLPLSAPQGWGGRAGVELPAKAEVGAQNVFL